MILEEAEFYRLCTIEMKLSITELSFKIFIKWLQLFTLRRSDGLAKILAKFLEDQEECFSALKIEEK